MKIAIAMWVVLLTMVSIVPVASAETVKPVIAVDSGQSVKVMYKTPSGREVNIAIEINGKVIMG